MRPHGVGMSGSPSKGPLPASSCWRAGGWGVPLEGSAESLPPEGPLACWPRPVGGRVGSSSCRTGPGVPSGEPPAFQPRLGGGRVGEPCSLLGSAWAGASPSKGPLPAGCGWRAGGWGGSRPGRSRAPGCRVQAVALVPGECCPPPVGRGWQTGSAGPPVQIRGSHPRTSHPVTPSLSSSPLPSSPSFLLPPSPFSPPLPALAFHACVALPACSGPPPVGTPCSHGAL